MARFVFQAALRWSDMDVYGHVNNARFLTLYEEARVALMFTAARQHGLTTLEEGVVISRHEVDYLRPVDYGDTVRIEMWVEEIRPSRFVIGYELFDDGAVASRKPGSARTRPASQSASATCSRIASRSPDSPCPWITDHSLRARIRRPSGTCQSR